MSRSAERPPPLLELRGVGKRFPGVVALDDVSLTIQRGEIHAIAGENGAGKSTLVKIIAGSQALDAGTLIFEGQPLHLRGPRDAINRGINTIYQELLLAPHLTVAENIFLGRLPTRFGAVDRERLHAEAVALIGRLGIELDVRQPVEQLGIAQRQIVEIARALGRQSTLLVLDEPSAVLGRHDLRQLFRVLRVFRDGGGTVLYISHRLEEIFELADRVTVLRDGRYVDTRTVASLTTSALVELMAGRSVDEMSKKGVRPPGDAALDVRGLTRAGVIRDVSFTVRRGEVVGLVGKVGSGRTEVARAIYGADAIDAGEIRIFGRLVRIRSPKDAVSIGVGLVPEDRKGQGILPDRSVLENVTLASLCRFLTAGVLDLRAEARAATGVCDGLAVRPPGLRRRMKLLSGGNQQKVVLGRWLSSGCRILILDEPTRGVDVRARMEIYGLMERLVGDGYALLMISSDASEILSFADRIVVMRAGAVAGTLSRADGTAEWSALERLMEGSSA